MKVNKSGSWVRSFSSQMMLFIRMIKNMVTKKIVVHRIQNMYSVTWLQGTSSCCSGTIVVDMTEPFRIPHNLVIQ